MGEILIAGMASLLICVFLGPRFIDFLREKEFGQHIREEGPEGHHGKAGTPTMDGLDGLAAGCAAIVLLSFTAMAFITRGQEDLALLSACLVGGCVGFLWFNSFPAEIFMGDTGSLGLGGAIAGLAVMTKTEVLLLVLGGIFVIEALSVVLQG